MQEHDWSSFQLRVPLASTRQRVYEAWTTQNGLESWFLRQAKFSAPDGKSRKRDESIAVNDSYEWLWHGWPDETIEKGQILQLNGKDFLQFSFGKAGNVGISIREEQGMIMLELLQDQIPTDEHSQVEFHVGCTKGWLFYLTNLKSILEGGIDLRNRNVQLKNVITS
jgi:uncharacterized protein YndB with AHSA1/START domain